MLQRNALVLSLLLWVGMASPCALAADRPSTAQPQVQVLKDELTIPGLNRQRRIRIYTPPGYATSNRRYPVLYMHDGQNLFDDATAYSGEWHVDETLNALARSAALEVIVVGIDNGADKRRNELNPWPHAEFGEGEGKAYVDFIVNTVKPLIDRQYRTRPERAQTGVMGSSMGGLITHYALVAYPQVFGKAGVFSPAYSIGGPQALEYFAKHAARRGARIYLLAGGQEGYNMVENAQRVYDAMRQQGHKPADVRFKIVPPARHNEAFWASEFEQAVRWLFEVKTDYPPLGVAVRAEKVAAHSYYVPGLPGEATARNQGFMSNAGFVITPAGVVVFDTLGSPSLAQAMVRRIRSLTAAPIRRVVLSHYHADHYYGVQVFKDLGADIWAHQAASGVIGSEAALQRYAQRKDILGPWINDQTQRFPQPDLWLSGDTDFELGGLHFQVRHVGPAHAPEDLVMLVREDGVLFAGDLVFKGRIPFVGDADSRLWLSALDKMMALKPKRLVPGHGAVANTPMQDMALTRDYLLYLRAEMGRAVNDMTPFDEAYEKTDWSRFQHLPAFAVANRRNAYNTYILMEKESVGR